MFPQIYFIKLSNPLNMKGVKPLHDIAVRMYCTEYFGRREPKEEKFLKQRLRRMVDSVYCIFHLITVSIWGCRLTADIKLRVIKQFIEF